MEDFVLMLALLAGPEPANTPINVMDYEDTAFGVAVEKFVRDSSPGGRPPAPYAALIARMGDDKYAVRDRASRYMERRIRAIRGDEHWLYWSLCDADPEIRQRSNAIIRRLHTCRYCLGTGCSSNWQESPCSICNGAGTTWVISIFDQPR